jgi:sec-independent protein translocase protein TatA
MISLFISGGEIFIVILVAVMLFGANKIPELARGLGKGMQEFRKATEEIKKELNDAELTKNIKDVKKDVDSFNIKKDIDDITNQMKG